MDATPPSVVDHRTTNQRNGERHRPGERERERQRWRRGRPVPDRRHGHRRGGHERTLRAQLGHADGRQRRAHDHRGARDAAGNTTTSAAVPSTSPTPTTSRTRSWPPASTSRRRSSSCRTGGCWSRELRARSRCSPRRTRNQIPMLSCRSPTSARPACSRASTTSRSTRTSPPTTSTTSSTRSGRPTTTASRASPPTPALTGTVADSEFVLYEDPQDAHAEHHGGALNFANDGQAAVHDRRALHTDARATAHQPARQGAPDQPGRDDPDRQSVLRRTGPERRLDLGARPAKPVPRLLRPATRPLFHRRRRR